MVNENHRRTKEKSNILSYYFKRLFRKNYLLLNIYSRLFLKKCASQEERYLNEDFNDVDKVFCSTQLQGKYSEYFSTKDIENISKYNLDFVLRFGFGIIKGEILKVAKYGVW